jgi:hypothetical protein
MPMTERERTPRPRRRKPSALPVAAGSLAAFMGLFGYMAYQLRTGHDPALGAKTASAPAPLHKRVVVKRIEHHIVITKLLPPREEQDDGGSVQTAAPVAAAPPSAPVVTQRSAPVPTPAPAPAPVQTRTS